MTAGTGYALGALFAFGLGDFIYKQSMRAGIRPPYFLAGLAWVFNPVIIVYALSTGTLVIAPAALWGCLAGLAIFIGQQQFLKSLGIGSVSITTPIFRLNFIVTVILAITILHESLTPLKIVAFALALAATWLLVAGFDRGSRPVGAAYFMHLATATLTMGAGSFLQKLGLRDGASPETMLVAQALVFGCLATAYLRSTEGTLKIPAAAWRHSLPAALLAVSAFLLMLHGLSIGPASVLVPIAQMGFVITSVLGIILLREPLTLRLAIGLLVAMLALLALAMSNGRASGAISLAHDPFRLNQIMR